MMRFYRALLRLYPTGFRAEYRDELCEAFAERMRDHVGPLAPLTRFCAALADVVPNAAAVHADILRQDLRYAARALRRAPGFTLTAVIVVALGVGANTAAFSLADFVLLRPLSFRDPERLVKLWQRTPGYARFELSPANYRDWKRMATTVEAMEAYNARPVNLVGASEPRRLDAARLTPGTFQLLGVSAFAGRGFTEADSADGNVVVLSYTLWQTQFGGDPSIVGSVVRLDGAPYAVIGVMPPEFRFPTRETAAWTPLLLRGDDLLDRNDNYLEVVARLKHGVGVARAQQEFSAIAARLEQAFPKENHQTGAAVVALRADLSQRARLLVLALCGASLCILLLACANLASLLLSRAMHRAPELAVRAALGAGRERLVRQLVTESVVVALLGGVVGVLVAAAGLPLLARLVPPTLPVAEQPALDLRVLLFAAALVALTGLAFGIGPAVAAGRSRALESLRDAGRSGGKRTRRLRAAFVVVEVAASVVLLICSGLLLRAVLRIQATDPGFVAENVLAVRTALPFPKYDLTARREDFYARVLSGVRALPGVSAAAYATGLPLDMRGGIFPVRFDEGPGVADASNSASLRAVTPSFFGTLGIPLVRGRDIADSDTRETPPVAVVSESFAERYWAGEDPIGKRFGFAFSERVVVGVVGDVRFRGLERESEPQVYIASRQMADSSLIYYPPKELVVRTSAPAATLVPAIRRIVAAADPEQPVSHIRTLTEIVADETAPRLTHLRLLGALSGIALLIAGVGIHGLLTFTVSRREQELGVRRALGEPARSLVGSVLREGVALALGGVVAGVALAYLAARAMGALLVGVRPEDPATIALAAGLCFATVLAGSLRPAVRAARADPLAVIRGS